MKILNDKLVFEPGEIKHKKITGHSFVDLIGVNPYVKAIGDVILERFGIIKNEVDPKYLYRGNLAEQIVRNIYTRDGHTCIVYNQQDVNWDNFHDNPDFGGLLDIELPLEKTIIEVKSKSLKDFDKICNDPPKYEYWQGIYYAYLKNYDKAILEWIFFDPQTEQQAFNQQPISSLKNIKRFTQEYKLTPVVKEEIKKRLDIIKNYYNTCFNTRSIPLKDISQEVLKCLNL